MQHDRVWDKFQVGFWHPFGPYTGLSTRQVLDWKRDEIRRFGWTFWSFAYSPNTSAWLDLLKNVKGPVYALCSHSPGARDPDKTRGEQEATHYCELDEKNEWRSMPDGMKVTNPFKRRGLALGFKVGQVIECDPVFTPKFSVEWFSKQDQAWRSGPLPTRGEYLIRKGTGTRLRAVEAVLELVPPYLVVCDAKTDPTKAI